MREMAALRAGQLVGPDAARWGALVGATVLRGAGGFFWGAAVAVRAGVRLAAGVVDARGAVVTRVEEEGRGRLGEAGAVLTVEGLRAVGTGRGNAGVVVRGAGDAAPVAGGADEMPGGEDAVTSAATSDSADRATVGVERALVLTA